MDDFDCTHAGRAIADYVDELSNWYVRLSRRRFWDGDRAAFATLRHCLVEVAKLLAPFTPFVADEIYTNLTAGTSADDSVHLRDFPEPDAELDDGELEAGVEAALRAIELGRAARAAGEGEDAPAAAQGGDRRHRGRARARSSGSAETRRAPSSTSRSSSSSPRRASWSRYVVKPNYRTLGPRFGKQMPQAAAAIEALDPEHVAEAIRGERRIGINIDGHEHDARARRHDAW